MQQEILGVELLEQAAEPELLLHGVLLQADVHGLSAVHLQDPQPSPVPLTAPVRLQHSLWERKRKKAF
jgi:hypothetical protein